MLESLGALTGHRGRQRSPNMDLLHSTLSLALVLHTSLLDVLEWVVMLPVTIFHGYSSLIRWAADSVHSLFDAYGYWVIFLGTLSENTLLLGLIVPGVLVLILAGLSAEEGDISAPICIALGIAGTIIGDTISYFLGRYGWARFGHGTAAREALDKVREPILRRGPLFILVYHFAGYTRLVGPAAAGVFHFPFRRWAPADYTGASLWVSSYVGLGYLLGSLGFTLNSSDRWFRYIEWALLLVVLAFGLYFFRIGQKAWLSHQREVEEETEATGAGGPS